MLKKEPLSFFVLNKFYFDVVTPSGDYFIGYNAELKFGKLSVCYSDTVCSSGVVGVNTGPSFDKNSNPVETPTGYSWTHSKLGFQGFWQPASTSISNQLHTTKTGKVDWHCLQPRSKVKVETSSGLEIEALGYCEQLSLSILPWNLGLKKLIWGRYVSENNVLVWIEWVGSYNKRILYCNGEPIDLVEASDEVIKSAALSIKMHSVANIRQGLVGPNILSKVPSVAKLAPLAMLNVHEHKQLSRGVLKFCDGRVDEGWVIHETVIWP